MKTIVITGASAGFGAVMAETFAARDASIRFVLTGRRRERLAALAERLPCPVHVLAFDIRERKAVEDAFANLPPAFREVDALINNAGLALGLDPFQTADLNQLEQMVDTNIKGLIYATRAVLPGMVARRRGHVVNIGSVAGTYPYPGGHVYGGTKAFVEQFSLALRADLLGTNVRVTNIEPGLTGDTEFSLVRFGGDQEKARKVYEGTEPLTPRDVAEAVWWCLTLPPHVNINRIEMMPTCQATASFAIYRTARSP